MPAGEPRRTRNLTARAIKPADLDSLGENFERAERGFIDLLQIDARQFTINFANNNLLGSGNFIPAYRSSKARVCVTVGMMTTG